MTLGSTVCRALATSILPWAQDTRVFLAAHLSQQMQAWLPYGKSSQPPSSWQQLPAPVLAGVDSATTDGKAQQIARVCVRC